MNFENKIKMLSFENNKQKETYNTLHHDGNTSFEDDKSNVGRQNVIVQNRNESTFLKKQI